MMAVYWPHTSPYHSPDFEITREFAALLRERGEAESMKRGKAIRLKVARLTITHEPDRVVIRGMSCKMGPAMVEAFGAYALNQIIHEEQVGWLRNHEGLNVAWPMKPKSRSQQIASQWIPDSGKRKG